MTFELPLHNMCSKHQGLLYQHEVKHPDFIDFDVAGLNQCPNAIVNEEGVRFVYRGVAEGQAIYAVEE